MGTVYAKGCHVNSIIVGDNGQKCRAQNEQVCQNEMTQEDKSILRWRTERMNYVKCEMNTKATQIIVETQDASRSSFNIVLVTKLDTTLEH